MSTAVKQRIDSFTKLDAWREAHKLVLAIYRATKQFPQDELFGLVSQMRRSAVSGTSNIAEAFGRNSLKEKLQFYAIGQGSLTELQSQLLIARDLGYIDTEVFQEIAEQTVRTRKLLHGLTRSSQARPKSKYDSRNTEVQ